MSSKQQDVYNRVHAARQTKIEEGYETPNARLSRARLEAEDTNRRIESLRQFNNRSDRDYGSTDSTGGIVGETFKQLKRFGTSQIDTFGNNVDFWDRNKNVNLNILTPESTRVVNNQYAGNQTDEGIEYHKQQALDAGIQGLDDVREHHLQQANTLSRLKGLYRESPEDKAILDSNPNQALVDNIKKTLENHASGKMVLPQEAVRTYQKQLKEFENDNLRKTIQADAARVKTGNEIEANRERFATDYNVETSKELRNTNNEIDGVKGSWTDDYQTYKENPMAALGLVTESLPYALPVIGQAMVVNDVLGSTGNMTRNRVNDTGRLTLTDDEKMEVAGWTGAQALAMQLGRMNIKGSLGNKSIGSALSNMAAKPIGKAVDKVAGSLAGNPKLQKAFTNAAVGSGALTKTAGKIGTDAGFEFLQEGAQEAIEQKGSGRELDLDKVLSAAVAGSIGGGGTTTIGSALGAGKSAINYATNKVGDKIAESTTPMNDDDYLDSNSDKYSPVSVVEDANKALSTGNASRETIKQSKARIDNAKKSVNKEIQELERIVSLKTKQEQLIEQFKDADSISDSDMKIIEDNAEAIQNLPYSIKLDVAQERLTAAREAKISMEAEVSRAEAKVAKESTRSTNVAKVTKAQELITKQEDYFKQIEELETKLSDSNIDVDEQLALTRERNKIEEEARKVSYELYKLDPDGLFSEIKDDAESTPVTPQSIKEKLSGILKSPEVTANVSKKSELEELGRKLDSVVAQQNTLKKTDSVKGDIVEGGIEGDRKYIGTKEHLSNSIKAVDNKDDKAYKKQMGMLKNFETSHASKAKAMNEASTAFNETGKTQLVYREKGKLTWSYAPKTFFGKNSTRDKKKFGALEVHDKSGRLIKNIEDEAKHIKETREFIEDYKSKVANTKSTSAKGKNVNDKTSNTSNATGSVNTDNNKSKKVEDKSSSTNASSNISFKNVPTTAITLDDKSRIEKESGLKFTLHPNTSTRDKIASLSAINTSGNRFKAKTNAKYLFIAHGTGKANSESWMVQGTNIKVFDYVANNFPKGENIFVTCCGVDVKGEFSNLVGWEIIAGERIGKRFTGIYDAVNTVVDNKPKVNPVKNKNKNMITSWRQKDDNSGETNRQHDSITELYKEKNKGLKGKPVSELVLRDDERHAYNALSYLANKTIIAPNINSNNVVWESFAEDAFGENSNAGNYSKDDVVMLVMPQTEADFKALVPELNKALAANAEVIYMNERHTNNETTKKLITNNLVKILKDNGYTLFKDKSQNKINQGTKVEIFKAVKEETSTDRNTETKSVEEYKEDWKKHLVNNKDKKDTWLNNYVYLYAQNSTKSEKEIKELFPNNAKNEDNKWQAMVELIEETSGYKELVYFTKQAEKIGIPLNISNNHKYVAATNRDSDGNYFIKFNPEKISDLENYINSSEQKALVMKGMENQYGFSTKDLTAFLNTKEKQIDFLLFHEKSHIDNKDSEVYFKNGKSLITDDKLVIETRANLDALKAMGKTLKKIDTSISKEEALMMYEERMEELANTNKSLLEKPISVEDAKWMLEANEESNYHTEHLNKIYTEEQSKNLQIIYENHAAILSSNINEDKNTEEQVDDGLRNTVSSTENEVTQGNKTLLSQDEDIFTSVVLAKDWKRIAEQTGIEIEDNNIRQLEAYIEFHETITKGIEKLIDKRDAPSNLNNALFKYLAVTDDTGKIYLPKNVVAAISLSAFKYIQTEGKKLKLTDAQLLAVHGLDAYTKLYPQAKYKLSELGGHKAYMSQDMGKLAYAALDLSIGDNARVNTKQELEASLGAVVYTLLKTNTDLIKEQPPMTHREQLIRLVQSMPMGQAKDLVTSKTNIDVSTIKNKESLVKALKEAIDSYLEASITLARINNSYDKKAKEISIPEVGAKVINGSTKNPGQTDLLDKLFSVPRERAAPHDTAPKFTQETAKESRSLITKEAAKALNEVASYEWGIEGDKADLMIQLFDTDKDSFYSLLGLSSDAEINNLHSEIRDTELIETITRKNLLGEQIEWLRSRRNEDGTYKPFYQLPVVWQNSRFGYESTLFNAQTDIFARMLTNLKGWKATVETNKDADLTNEDGTVTKEGLFHLALAEKIEGVSSVFGDKFTAMGYDPAANTPDKVGPKDYLTEFVIYLDTNTEFKQAVSAMRDLLAGETLTEAKLDTLKSFTKLADTGELALGMLVEYISFQDARDAGETYTTYISLQSDGITNGPAITDILFGVFTDEKLLKAGIIPESLKDTFSNFYETKKAGYTDKYQDTGMDMSTVMFTYMPKGTSITDLLSTVDDKFGSRSWAKKLVTPFNYGSGTKSMKRNIANGFVDKVVGDYHSLYNMENKKERDALINQLNTLLSTASDIAINLKANKPVNNRDALVEIAYLHNNNTNDINKQIKLTAPDLLLEIMEKTPKFIQTKNEGKSRAEIVYAYSTFLRNNFEVHKFEKITDKNADENFSFSNRELLESLVDISFGTASAKAINTNEAASVAYRQDLTDVTIRAVEMEKFAEDILIDNFIPDSQLPDGLDTSQYDSPLEAKRVYMTVGQKKLIDAEMDKHRATMHSGLSAKYNASRDSGIVVAKEGLANTFGEQIKFGNPLRTEETSNTQGPSITFTYGYSYKTTSSPGVSASAMAVQSLDAAIATETVSKFKSMNLHDAASFSILDYTDGVKKQNQEFYDAVTTYDIGKEALESYLAPLRLLRSLLDNESISDKSKREIKKFIHNEVEGKRIHEKTKQEIGGVKIVDSLKSYSATKIAKLNTIHTVQQYGGVDGQVVVDKVDTSNMLSDIESTIKEAVNLIEGRETKPVEEEVTPIQDVNTSELESSISTNKLSLTGLIGVLNNAMPDSNVSEILNSLNDINLTKVKVKTTKKRMSEIVRFSKLDNTLYIDEGAFNLVGNNQIMREIQRGVLEAALHNNLKAVKNGSTHTGTLTDSYRGMQLLVNALPSMVERAAEELVPGTQSTYLISHAEKNTILNVMRGNRGKSVERIIASILLDDEFVSILKKIPNYTDIDSKDIKRGNIFSKIKEFIIDLVTNGFDSPNRESIYNLLTATSNEIVSELQEARGLESINGLINKSMIVNQNQDSVNHYDYEYDNALLNGYDTQFHLEIAKMAMNQGSAVFDTDTILILAHKLLSDTPYDNDGYNQTLIPVIEMLQKYLGTGNKATKVIMVQDRDSIDSITKDEWLTNRIGNIIESGRSLFTMIGDNRYVFLSNAMVSSSADTKIATVIHELLHAFTAETLNDPKNKAIRANFEKMRKDALEQVTEEQLESNYQLSYALNESLPIDEFVVQVLTVPSVREAVKGLTNNKVNNEGRTKEEVMFYTMAQLFGYKSTSKEDAFLLNFAKMFGKLTLNNTVSRQSAIEVSSAALGSREAYKTARVKQSLIDIGYLDNIDQVAKAIAEETKDLGNYVTELEFIKQKAAENNNAVLLDDIAVYEQQVHSQRVLKSPEITFTPKEVRSRIQENDVSESTNREYLNVIENSILTPLDYLIDDALIKGFRPETIWHDAVVNGENLTVSNAYDVGFELNNEQGYMLETLESILSKVIDKVNNTAAYRQMESVYKSAKDTLVASDFHDGDWDNATQEEKQIAREKLTYLFRPQDSGIDGKSNYLVRFAALSMVSPEIQAILNFKANNEIVGETWFEKATSLFSEAMEIVDGGFSGVSGKGNLNDRITELALSMAKTYAKENDKLSEIENNVANKIESVTEMFSETLIGAAKEAGIKLTDTDLAQKHPIGRLTNKALKGELDRFQEYADFFMDYVGKNSPLGNLRETINETLTDTSKEQELATDSFNAIKLIESIRGKAIDAVRRNILDSYSKANKKMSKEDTKAISNLLRADIQSLRELGLTHNELMDIVTSRNTRDQKAKELLDTLPVDLRNELQSRGDNLGYYLVKGVARKPLLAKNAFAILSRVGMGKGINTNFTEDQVKNLDALITFYALNYSDADTLNRVADINSKETGDINGLEHTILSHQKFTRESDSLFMDNPFSKQKGYIPSIYNTDRGFAIVKRSEVEDYKELGYKENSTLETALHEDEMTNKEDMVFMTLSNTGKQRYVSGAFSVESPGAKGSSVEFDSDKFVKIAERQRASIDTVSQTNMIPIYDTDGNIRGYRYEMGNTAKDSYLDRNNDFSTLLAQFKGANISKENFPDSNKKLVDALIDKAKNMKDNEINSYILISPNSSSKRAREFWAMLPKETRMYIENQTGEKGILVKKNELNLLIGYRKYNPSDAFTKEYADKNIAELVYTSIFEAISGKKAKLRFDQGFKPLLEVVSALKNFIVIRGIKVLIANIKSNIALLMINGFTPIQSMRDIKDALVYSIRYQNQASELQQLEHEVSLGYGDTNKISRMTELKNSIARNPLKAFIEEGMMPMIVNDFSFKKGEVEYNTFIDDVKDATVNKLPAPLRKTFDVLTVAEGTKIHNFLANATQQSDFVFKYAIHQQEMRKGKTNKEALNRAREVFINYDIPTNRFIQFLNDTGLWMFTKFALRIQRVILRLMKEKPLRLATEALVSEQLGNPSIISLNLISSAGGGGGLRNPMTNVLSMYEHALPIQLLTSVFK